MSPHGIASTIWARPDVRNDPEITELLRQRGIFDAMEEDFRAKQVARAAVKRDKSTLITYLDSRQGQNISAFRCDVPRAN